MTVPFFILDSCFLSFPITKFTMPFEWLLAIGSCDVTSALGSVNETPSDTVIWPTVNLLSVRTFFASSIGRLLSVLC